MSVTLVQARNDLLSKLGIEDIADASALALQDVVIALNGALQMLQTAGESYFTKQNVTITLSAGTATYTLPASVQTVIGPVRWNDSKPLRALSSMGEWDQFARIFLGESADGQGDPADPIAYWVEFDRSGSAGDICAITLKLAPPPIAPAGTLVMETVSEAPSYTVDHLDDTTVLPVAQNYAESILLPIARMLVTRSSQFSRPDLLAQITSDAQAAMQRIGLAGGFPQATQPQPSRETIG